MKEYQVEISKELSESVEATQLELQSVKDLLGFCYSTTAYTIPEERINKLEKEYKELDIKYNILKQEVENLSVKSSANKMTTSWSLDFKTHIVTVTENE